MGSVFLFVCLFVLFLFVFVFFTERENISSYIWTSVMHQCLLLRTVWTAINMQNIVFAVARLLFSCAFNSKHGRL